MYTLKSAIAQPINSKGRWIAISLGELLLPAVFATYDRILATLSNPFLTADVCLDLATVRPEFGSQSITFNAMLVALGNRSLDTSNTLPVLKTRYAHYQDAFRGGYKVNAVHPTAGADSQIPESDKTWLRLMRVDTDYELFYRSCLVSVNGFIHATDAGPDGVFIRDGMKTQHATRRNEIGFLSFNGIGSLSFIPITESMIYKQKEDQQYSNRAHIDLGVDVSDKTVMLVLGGYLHVLDTKTFYRISETAFSIAFNNLAFIDRYFDSVDTIDLTSLGLEHSDVNDSQISINQLLSDEVIVKYLTLSQSFFVILDNKEIFVEHDEIHSSKMPGMYVSHTPPKYPLMSELGKMVNYWHTYEDGQYSVVANTGYRDNPVYRTVNVTQVNSVSSARNTSNPFKNGDLHYLKIGADI